MPEQQWLYTLNIAQVCVAERCRLWVELTSEIPVGVSLLQCLQFMGLQG